MSIKLETLIVGGGCFWCIEAIFQQIIGVEKVVSGYTGGNCPGIPTYREVCSGKTGHAEVVKVTYNAAIISFEELLLVFMTNHDATTKHQQITNIGSQYRSVIYYKDTTQQEIATEMIQQLAPYFEKPIVTEISPVSLFYEAEAYHQNYYTKNSSEGYCEAMIRPKLAKLRTMYAEKIKETV